MLPEETLNQINDYVNQGKEPGEFILAVLENNLMNAVSKATLEDRKHFFNIVLFVRLNIDVKCWGSPEKVEAYIKGKQNEATCRIMYCDGGDRV